MHLASPSNLSKHTLSPHPHPSGYKEVTLLGQNIDAYGRDLDGMAADGSGRRAHTFTDLLRTVHDVPGIERIRFATSHPRYFTGERPAPLWPLRASARQQVQTGRLDQVLPWCRPAPCVLPPVGWGASFQRPTRAPVPPCHPPPDRLVRACSELPKLCEFFHIPFQSGDDDILRAMKRGYTADRCGAAARAAGFGEPNLPVSRPAFLDRAMTHSTS